MKKNKCHEIDEVISPFLDIGDIVQNRPILIEYDKFLKTLMNNLHNCTMAHQRAHKKNNKYFVKRHENYVIGVTTHEFNY